MNRNLIIKDIINCTGGELITGDDSFVCETYSKDTRNINKGDVYIGIKGENFDGNLFWKEALNKGAKVVIVQDIDFSKENVEKFSDKIIVKVQDTMKALHEMAKLKRNKYGKDFPVIGVTGSVGKTSTKDIIASVLETKYKVLKTIGNNNNEIGLPFTILKLKDHDVAVIEMGMNHFGEISRLSKIAKPTISVITNIGTSHIGNLGSRENILKAKIEILDGMEKPYLVLNNDNDLLHDWCEENAKKMKIGTFGIENQSDAMADDIVLNQNDSCFVCNIKGEIFKIKVPVGGKHFVLNSLCATLIGKILGLTNSEIARGISNLELSKKRMEVINLKNDMTLINDSYNASFESMKMAIEYLANTDNNRKIAVLGDMFELGDYEKELHKKVGKEVAKNNIDVLICCGKNAKLIAEEAKAKGMDSNNIYYVGSIKDVYEKLKKVLKPKDAVLIKASNGMKFYEIAENLISIYSKNKK